ncbi:TetR/AcrR family transcriptional regulator [Anaerocolumna sp. MB42-C2]|uniref:TetR/AcrR family transcriptional regulator n=1 Tax=Anaerocolumna sp. MB42-C2 TaxID=3070997 RepID=UPI0027E1778F|nr:TetR/AcrR family transcriptional regulator [Anaerocolumna sp. MB42-C2]WMJ90342.1 TetR/AcrR family transcriptional regulator [Anaerocolumna sp. MB42-C2]
MNRMNYRIALQSKKMLTDGLLKLMETNDYLMITVTQICQEAELSRRTFYRLYETKEDIIKEYMHSLTEDFMNTVAEAIPLHYTEVAMMYFEFWKQHEVFLKLLKKNKMLDLIYRIEGEMAPLLFRKVKPEVNLDDETLLLLLAYSLGGLNGMLIQWVEAGMKMSSDQLKTHLDRALRIALI